MGDPEKTLEPPANSTELAAALEPALREACAGRLHKIEWFTSAWQRSGSATGYADFELAGGEVVSTLVKLPVGPRELYWTEALGRVDASAWSESEGLPTPRVLAAGDEIGGHDLGWIVEERFDEALDQGALDKRALTGMLNACAAFHLAARGARPVDRHPEAWDWEEKLHESREALASVDIPNAQHWNAVLKKVHRSIRELGHAWEHRPCTCWCHGDLHAGNVMRRRCGDGSARPVLIDMGLVHAGHWVEDAVYLERQFWGRMEDLRGLKPVSVMARRRKALGQTPVSDYQHLARVRRVLMAVCVPAVATREGSEAYIRGALEVLESTLPLVSG